MVDASGHFALALPALCQTRAVPKEGEVQDPGHTACRQAQVQGLEGGMGRGVYPERWIGGLPGGRITVLKHGCS